MTKLALLFMFVVLSQQALNGQADADIRNAIKSAVLDGLQTVDDYVLNTYWYYLRGAQKEGFNVTILPNKLNYIRVYSNLGNYFRVNCDIDKITWSPSINSFVQIVTPINKTSNAQPNISLLNQNNMTVDLTSQITVTAEDQAKMTSPQSKAQVISNTGQPSQGIVVLST
jgi:hypothetical protein